MVVVVGRLVVVARRALEATRVAVSSSTYEIILLTRSLTHWDFWFATFMEPLLLLLPRGALTTTILLPCVSSVHKTQPLTWSLYSIDTIFAYHTRRLSLSKNLKSIAVHYKHKAPFTVSFKEIVSLAGVGIVGENHSNVIHHWAPTICRHLIRGSLDNIVLLACINVCFFPTK